MTDAHLVLAAEGRAVLETRVLADENPTIAQHVEEIKVALKCWD